MLLMLGSTEQELNNSHHEHDQYSPSKARITSSAHPIDDPDMLPMHCLD